MKSDLFSNDDEMSSRLALFVHSVDVFKDFVKTLFDLVLTIENSLRSQLWNDSYKFTTESSRKKSLRLVTSLFTSEVWKKSTYDNYKQHYKNKYYEVIKEFSGTYYMNHIVNTRMDSGSTLTRTVLVR